MPKKKFVRRIVRKKKVTTPSAQKVSLKAQQQQAINKKLVVLEDNVLKTLVNDKRFTSIIPCLSSGKQALANVGRKCGRCSKARKLHTQRAMNQIKQCVAGLKGDQQKKLKQLLGTEQIRVVLAGAKKQVTL